MSWYWHASKYLESVLEFKQNVEEHQKRLETFTTRLKWGFSVSLLSVSLLTSMVLFNRENDSQPFSDTWIEVTNYVALVLLMTIGFCIIYFLCSAVLRITKQLNKSDDLETDRTQVVLLTTGFVSLILSFLLTRAVFFIDTNNFFVKDKESAVKSEQLETLRFTSYVCRNIFSFISQLVLTQDLYRLLGLFKRQR